MNRLPEQTLIELSGDALITVGKAGKITIFNSAAEEIFGYTSREVVGRSSDVLVPPARQVAHRQRLQTFLNSSEAVSRMASDSPVRFRRKDGTDFLCEIGMAKLETRGEAVLALRLRDISQRVKEDDLRTQLLAAEENTVMKAFLMDTMAHELRSPLSAILGFTSLLLDYDDRLDADERRQQLRVIQDSTHHLQRIVDDLLALSRLEAGALEIRQQPVPLKSLFSSVLASSSARSGHVFKLTPRDTRLTALGDQSRLRQVLSNLVDNALKYSPDNTEVEITARRTSGVVTITVRDHGPGVPPGETDLIFEPFYRSSNADRDESKSTGLGLAICKGLIEAHGGTIKASLPEDGGLAVTLTLPAAESSKAAA